ncbi:MAG: PEGA domain-containing protein [Bryobacteraceae bacterium]
MKKGLLTLAVALMTLAPMSASAAVWGGYWGPYWRAPYYAYGYGWTGEVKVDTKVKNAEVFIDGAYAGTTHQAKSMHLRPGAYNIEIRELGATKFSQRVYVAAGRTLHLRPQL